MSDLEAVVDAVVALASEQRAVGSRIDQSASQVAFRDRLASLTVDQGVIVAESDGDIVGVVTVDRLEDALTRTATVGVIEYLYVDPDRRNEGIGSNLLDHAEDTLRARGVDIVELEVMEANEAARRFYCARNYTCHRRRLAKDLESGDQRRESE